MKYKYKEIPEPLKGSYAEYSHDFGFNWKEFVMTIPSPLFLVTTYKKNGAVNACMQSWATFTSANKGNGFYAILASVNKNGHLYKTVHETNEAVINFMSADYHGPCMATIRNNQEDMDELEGTGLTAERGAWVNAPVINECFMNLECRFVWDKEIVPGDDHVMMCLEVVGGHIDEKSLSEKTGESGLLYNLHYPLNPEEKIKTAHDYAGVIQKVIDAGEY